MRSASRPRSTRATTSRSPIRARRARRPRAPTKPIPLGHRPRARHRLVRPAAGERCRWPNVCCILRHGIWTHDSAAHTLAGYGSEDLHMQFRTQPWHDDAAVHGTLEDDDLEDEDLDDDEDDEDEDDDELTDEDDDEDDDDDDEDDEDDDLEDELEAELEEEEDEDDDDD